MWKLASFALLIIASVFSSTCGSPSAPTPPPSATRIIRLGGNLNFGDVTINTVRTDGILTISNDGNANLTFTSISGPCASAFSASPTSGNVAPGQTTNVAITFAPTTPSNCSGNIVVAGDHTAGTNSIGLVARGTLDGIPLFSRAGSGDNAFTIPSYVTQLRVVATYGGFCQNFVAKANGRLIINIIIGTCSVADTRTPFNGTYVVPAGATITTEISTGVSWSFTEDRSGAPPTPPPTPTPPSSPPSGGTCSAAGLPTGTTAVCNDNTYSQSQNRSGTCSSHGGVKCWVCPGPLCNGFAPSPLEIQLERLRMTQAIQ